MKFITMFILTTAIAMSTTIDFESDDRSWYALNDGVMGGLSNGKVTYSDNALVFTGNLSFENNGGFASIRSPYGDWNLGAFETIEIRYRSSGQEFGFVLEKERAYWQPTYQFSLPESKKWKVLEMPLAEFEAHRLGKKMGYMLAKDDRSNLIRLGVITNEKTTEAFELEIDYITFK